VPWHRHAVSDGSVACRVTGSSAGARCSPIPCPVHAWGIVQRRRSWHRSLRGDEGAAAFRAPAPRPEPWESHRMRELLGSFWQRWADSNRPPADDEMQMSRGCQVDSITYGRLIVYDPEVVGPVRLFTGNLRGNSVGRRGLWIAAMPAAPIYLSCSGRSGLRTLPVFPSHPTMVLGVVASANVARQYPVADLAT
jgi:hypothetical protein